MTLISQKRDRRLERGNAKSQTLWVLIIIMALGAVVGYNYIVNQLSKSTDRLPFHTRLEDDLNVIEKSGEPVSLSQLKGKVFVAGYVFTRCPRGCSGISSYQKELQTKFGSDPTFHLASFSLDGEYDTPEVLRSYCQGLDISGDNWWFVTGDTERIRGYMKNQFRFGTVRDIPKADQTGPQDLYIHDMRLALVDHKAHIRGYYEVAHPQMAKEIRGKLERHIAKLLAEAAADKR